MPTLVEDILRLTGTDVSCCRACEECSARFAVKDGVDLSPTEVIRRVLADDRDALFTSHALWLLSGGQARRVQCEKGVELAKVLASLRRLALDAHVPSAEPEVTHLMQAFTGDVHTHGRVHHRALLSEMRRRLCHAATEQGQEIAMLLGRKLRLLPGKVKDIEGIRRLFSGEREGDTR